MEELLALVARCEAAISADRELDARIWCAVSPPPESYTIDSWHRGDPRPAGADVIGLTLADWLSRWPDDAAKMADSYGVLKYTGSLDAAMKLLPDTDAATAMFWKLGNDGEGGDPALFKATILVAHVLASKSFTAVADTAPLALTAAALKARAGEGSV